MGAFPENTNKCRKCDRAFRTENPEQDVCSTCIRLINLGLESPCEENSN